MFIFITQKNIIQKLPFKVQFPKPLKDFEFLRALRLLGRLGGTVGSALFPESFATGPYSYSDASHIVIDPT